MLQYLINLTLIWAVCITVYELLLKKETHHRWNRAYLLLSLAAGLCIPLISLRQDVAQATVAPVATIRKVIVINEVIPQSAGTAASNTLNWWFICYLAGVLVTLFFLVRSALLLAVAYRKSQKTRHGRFTLAETGSATGPYSFFRFVFISSRKNYTPAELEMLLQHEYRHGRMLHSIDLILIHLLQAVLWFHPFIYWYRKRLQLVHEYEADEVAREDCMAYGTFLLEQSLLQTPVLLTHSFQHSPIKNRIIMLTKKSSAGSRRMKYLLAIPMTVTFLLLCSQSSFSHEKVKKGNKETFKGNIFEYPGNGSGKQVNIVAENQADVVTLDPEPEKLNGEHIYEDTKVTEVPQLTGPVTDMVQAVFDKVADKLSRLENGVYEINIFTMIVDKKGNLAYYSVDNIRPYVNQFVTAQKDVVADVDPVLKKEILQGIEAALDGLRFKPATVNGKPVNAYINNSPFSDRKVMVKDHYPSLRAARQ